MYKYNNQNITANYYPINSAIAIRDESSKLQLTVSNDRSQGGSSLAEGKVELMQNRRIPCDDEKGEWDFLNETDSTGRGIRVPATYYVQLSNIEQRPSFQRKAQQKVADPLQIAFNGGEPTEVSGSEPSGKKSVLEVPRALKDVKNTNLIELKYVMVPMDKNKIMIRVENLNDEFDGVTQPLSFDIDAIAKGFWNEVNPKVALKTLKISETSVTGNMEVSEMEQRRLHWKTTESSEKPILVSDPSNILPMQIRVFVIEYEAESESVEILQ